MNANKMLVVSLAMLAGAVLAGEHAHEHKPPHGGTLIVFGEEFAHLELVLDAKTGKLTGYVLDAEPEKAVRIKQEEIVLKVSSVEGKESSAEVKLAAVANVLTGESAGNTSQFEAQSDILKDAKKFVASLKKIKVKGKEFKDVEFHFPEGNEGHGHDEKDHKHEKKK